MADASFPRIKKTVWLGHAWTAMGPNSRGRHLSLEELPSRRKTSSQGLRTPCVKFDGQEIRQNRKHVGLSQHLHTAQLHRFLLTSPATS